MATCTASDDSKKSDIKRDCHFVCISFIQNPRKGQSHLWGQRLDNGQGWGGHWLGKESREFREESIPCLDQGVSLLSQSVPDKESPMGGFSFFISIMSSGCLKVAMQSRITGPHLCILLPSVLGLQVWTTMPCFMLCDASEPETWCMVGKHSTNCQKQATSPTLTRISVWQRGCPLQVYAANLTLCPAFSQQAMPSGFLSHTLPWVEVFKVRVQATSESLSYSPWLQTLMPCLLFSCKSAFHLGRSPLGIQKAGGKLNTLTKSNQSSKKKRQARGQIPQFSLSRRAGRFLLSRFLVSPVLAVGCHPGAAHGVSGRGS